MPLVNAALSPFTHTTWEHKFSSAVDKRGRVMTCRNAVTSIGMDGKDDPNPKPGHRDKLYSQIQKLILTHSHQKEISG